MACNPSGSLKNYDTYPVYDGNDLGVQYTAESTTFKLWAPTAKQVVLRLYNDGITEEVAQEFAMKKAAKGIWQLHINENL